MVSMMLGSKTVETKKMPYEKPSLLERLKQVNARPLHESLISEIKAVLWEAEVELRKYQILEQQGNH